MSGEELRVAETRLWTPTLAEGATAELARVSPDGKRLAYASILEGKATLCVEDRKGSTQSVTAWEEMLPESIVWSPDGAMLAYVLAEDRDIDSKRVVSWVKVDGGKPEGNVGGSVCAFRPDSGAVIVYSQGARTILAYGIGSEDVTLIGHALHNGDPAYPPRLAVSHDGSKVAISVQDTFDEVFSVYVYKREGEAFATSYLTDVPGTAACVCPFWSPKGGSLGLLISHAEREKSGIAVFRPSDAEGTLLYESDLVVPPVAPDWSPSGNFIAFVEAVEAPPVGVLSRVALLDCREKTLSRVTAAGEILGGPRWLRSSVLVIDGGRDATILRFETAP